MARVNHFVEGGQSVRAHPTELDCHFQLIEDGEGARLLHLSTFGSADRESKPKSSQSIQLDRRAARELIGVIEEAFPGLGAAARFCDSWLGGQGGRLAHDYLELDRGESPESLLPSTAVVGPLDPGHDRDP